MGTAIVVTSGKGGVGKSTVSLGLASQFAAGGERVLLLDCDAGLRSLDRMTGTEEALVFDSSDVVAGRCAPADAIYPCVTMPGVSLMPAPASGEDLVPERVMLRLVPLLKRYFDRVILDQSGVRLIGIVPEDRQMTAAFQRGCVPADDLPGMTALSRIAARMNGVSVPLSL